MIEWDVFQRDYDTFWALQPTERRGVDGSLIALIFVMLAMGTQFVTVDSAKEKEQTAEFYLSASHQGMCFPLFRYFRNRTPNLTLNQL